MGERIGWLDTARGLGIVLVVAGHAERGIVASGLTTSPWWGTLDLALYTFHMPLFMLLAGINVPHSLRKGRGPFLREKLWTIAYPYVLWSLVQGALLVLLAGLTNGSGATWQSLAMIGWKPISPFWFLYALFVYMVAIAVLGMRRHRLVPLAAVAIVASGIFVGDTLVHQICYQFPFFCLGILFGERIKAARIGTPLRWLPILALVWLACFQIVPADGRTPYLTPWSLPAAIAGIATVLVLAQSLRGRIAAWLGYAGSASMTIYVLHILVTAGTRIVLVKLHLPIPAAAMLGLCTFTGVAGPLAAHALLARAGWLPLLGLARRRPGSRRIGAAAPAA